MYNNVLWCPWPGWGHRVQHWWGVIMVCIIMYCGVPGLGGGIGYSTGGDWGQ